jgi:hypothetical protein
VPALVVCSILLPLFFLLGLHRPGPGCAPRCHGLVGRRICISFRTRLPLRNSFAASLTVRAPHLPGYGSLPEERRAAVVISTVRTNFTFCSQEYPSEEHSNLHHPLNSFFTRSWAVSERVVVTSGSIWRTGAPWSTSCCSRYRAATDHPTTTSLHYTSHRYAFTLL